MFAIVEADEYGEERVLPHERTYRAHKEERLRLLEAVRAHLGFVFLLYGFWQDVFDEVEGGLDELRRGLRPR